MHNLNYALRLRNHAKKCLTRGRAFLHGFIYIAWIASHINFTIIASLNTQVAKPVLVYLDNPFDLDGLFAKDNIVGMNVDAIVNAANIFLMKGGGLSGAIFKVAGSMPI